MNEPILRWPPRPVNTLIDVERAARRIACLLALLLAAGACGAGPLRERLAGRATDGAAQDPLDADEAPPTPGSRARWLPPQVQVLRDVSYGADERQRFDVYRPAHAHGAATVFMVHGGGWAHGDKTMDSVVKHKVAAWVPRGVVVVSVNYRMLPQAAPLEQARDVARALALAQARSAEWGGDPARFVLMGHSAGAHLVALLDAAPALAAEAGATRWLGSVLLDSAALDVPALMQARHLRLYDRAFGREPADWRAASPWHRLAARGAPLLAVCSTRRDEACPQARRYVEKAQSFGSRASVLPQDLSHRDINLQLGEPGAYSGAVEAFLRSLDDGLAATLAAAPR